MIAVMHKLAISAIARVLCAMEYGNAKAVKSVIKIRGMRFFLGCPSKFFPVIPFCRLGRQIRLYENFQREQPFFTNLKVGL